MKLLEALQLVASKGFPLEGTIEVPGGSKTLRGLTAAEAASLVEDRRGFAVRHLNCSLDEYEEWLALDGAPRCAAKTRSGSLCTNQIASAQQNIKDFLDLNRAGYCPAHGDR